VIKLREEVTWAWVTVVMAEAWTARAERKARESVVLLSSAHGEADEVAWMVTLLKGELAVAHQTQDMTEAKLPDLVDRAADAD
jgi:hypothetical protein